MSKLETFEGMTTNWTGLWWHPEYCGYSSASINLSELRKFKGKVRMLVRKNKFYEKDSNKPNYVFCLKEANSEQFSEMEVKPDKWARYNEEDETYEDEEGNRLFTREEVRKIINGTVSDVEYGIHDPYDILPEDFV